MKEKLYKFMQAEGLKSGQLAEMLHVNPAGISHILSGRNNPSFDLLQKILTRFPRVNPDWLLLDSDQMYRDEASRVPSVDAAPVHLNSRNDSLEVHSSVFGANESVDAETRSAQSQHPFVPKSKNAASATKVVARVIILYNDGSCDSYVPNKF